MELKDVKGLGPKRIEELNKVGIMSAEDLIEVFPKNYLDMTHVTPLSETYDNDIVLTLAKVEREPEVFTKGKMQYTKVQCSQNGYLFSIIWFNATYMSKLLEREKEYLFYGRVSNKMGRVSMTAPVFEEADRNIRLRGMVPVYPLKCSIPQGVFNKAVLDAIAKLKPKSVIPEYLENKFGLYSLTNAYYDVNDPSSEKVKIRGAERIAIEKYYSLVSAFKIIKGDNKKERNNKYSVTAGEIKEFSKIFGFELTDGQKKSINDIYKDIKGNRTMNRLLQGDVGSGKTAVSVCAMFMAVKSGYQCALLAPTEVLAKQNYNVAMKYLSDYNPVFLSGSMTAKEKKAAKELIKTGKVRIAVGTHALLTDDTEFENLSLVVCDEQQRFGVGQRSAILSKGKTCDMLVMSATPIPRTFSLIFFGDLDVSTIPDKPSNRVEIKTYIVPSSKFDDMTGFIQKEIDGGRQAYFVCPKIDGDDESCCVSDLYKEVSEKFPYSRVGMLHGKLKNGDKTDIMNRFKDGLIDILVSTTVVEVGVDVPNSTVMVIMDAERFGLSQLHQLRGRVGRSSYQSYCFLIMGKESEKATIRLSAIKNNSDGFKISEIDYDIRGGGDFLGTRQSGRFMSELGALEYPSSAIFKAKKISDEAFDNPENMESLKKIAKDEEFRLKNITLN